MLFFHITIIMLRIPLAAAVVAAVALYNVVAAAADGESFWHESASAEPYGGSSPSSTSISSSSSSSSRLLRRRRGGPGGHCSLSCHCRHHWTRAQKPALGLPRGQGGQLLEAPGGLRVILCCYCTHGHTRACLLERGEMFEQWTHSPAQGRQLGRDGLSALLLQFMKHSLHLLGGSRRHTICLLALAHTHTHLGCWDRPWWGLGRSNRAACHRSGSPWPPALWWRTVCL